MTPQIQSLQDRFHPVVHHLPKPALYGILALGTTTIVATAPIPSFVYTPETQISSAYHECITQGLKQTAAYITTDGTDSSLEVPSVVTFHDTDYGSEYIAEFSIVASPSDRPEMQYDLTFKITNEALPFSTLLSIALDHNMSSRAVISSDIYSNGDPFYSSLYIMDPEQAPTSVAGMLSNHPSDDPHRMILADQASRIAAHYIVECIHS